MKKLFLACMAVLVLAGCSVDYTFFTYKSQKELIAFINEDLVELGSMEADARKSMIEASKGPNKDLDQVVAAIENDAIPGYEDILDQIDSWTYKKSEMKKLVKETREAEEIYLEFLHKRKDALEATDDALMEESDDLLADYNKKVTTLNKHIEELAEDWEVELKDQ
ncbi:hypothetical protein [Rossellomorea marisflavi]|uniref:hypothetical protein n=1 Tax=Rossellomorea marisflavi TaxID=189381 RepID=UPI003515C120